MSSVYECQCQSKGERVILWTDLADRLHTADVSVWTEKNVLQLGLLLVNSLHRQLGTHLVFLGCFHLAAITSAIRSLLFGRTVWVNYPDQHWWLVGKPPVSHFHLTGSKASSDPSTLLELDPCVSIAKDMPVGCQSGKFSSPDIVLF